VVPQASCWAICSGALRGDTVHPSTRKVLYELDLLDDFLKLPHQKVVSAGGAFGDFAFQGPDFRRVPTRAKFIAFADLAAVPGAA
jgi:hypothetical protein